MTGYRPLTVADHAGRGSGLGIQEKVGFVSGFVIHLSCGHKETWRYEVVTFYNSWVELGMQA